MLERINARLKEDGIRARVEMRGHTYCLRATLPCRNGNGNQQQRITLPTRDITEADIKARELGRQLQTKTFSWESWDLVQAVDYNCADFRAAGRKLYERKYSTESAWQKKWRPALNKLPPDSVPATDAVLLSVIESMKPGSAGRRDQGNVLSQIAHSLKLNGSVLQEAARGYTTRSVTERDIPHDTEIEQLHHQIKQPHWRWMFGMCATYGLRPHEIVEAHITPEGNCEISDDTKTGFHIAWPCHERWLTEFDLRQISRPRQTVSTVAKAANDYLHKRGPVPFSLYNLRHAYAVRLFEKSIPSEVGARLMGHGEDVHRTTYRRWYDRRRIAELRHQYTL